jgi:FkbM family methyltransferase
MQARQILPDVIPKPLGAFLGYTFQRFARPVLGLLFDVFQGRYRTGGCEFEIPRDQTTRNFRACFFLDDCENEERGLIARHIRPEDSVLEYGACIGVVSCTTNKLLNSNSKHIVIEGNPLLISSIAKNRVLNDCTFVLINGVAAAERGLIPFHIHPEFIVGGSTRDVGSVVFQVEGFPLAVAIERFGEFGVLILDVEGGELELLESGAREIGTFRIVIVEMHRFAYQEAGLLRCREILTHAGFQSVEQLGDTEVWEKAFGID